MLTASIAVGRSRTCVIATWLFLMVLQLWLIGTCTSSPQNVGLLLEPPAKLIMEPRRATCTYNRVYSMLQARCSDDSKMVEIPSNLRSEIQVLEVTLGRVRELTNNSLAPYKNLAYLYLTDNFIQTIEEGAFDHTRYLEVLYLNTNGLDDLPKSIFRLPYLRKLVLSGNKLTDSVFRVDASAPLDYLEIVQNKLTRLPEFESLPTLVYLNVSHNPIGSIIVDDLAPYCSLKVLDASRSPSLRFDNRNCECDQLKSWIKLRDIKFSPDFNCTRNSDCVDITFANSTLRLYDSCLNVLRVQAEAAKARTIWILVASCVSGFLFCVFVALCCVHKRNKKKRRKLKKEQQRVAINNANTELLHSNIHLDNK